MAITDELREWFKDRIFMANGWQEINAIADRIDAEHEADVSTACRLAAALDNDALAERGYIALPVDADGVPIHVGDEVAFLGRMTVDATDGHNVFFFADNWADGVYCVRADELRHYHAPTVEDVLREFAEKIIDSQIPSMHPTYEEAIAEYAARLRLVGDGE